MSRDPAAPVTTAFILVMALLAVGVWSWRSALTHVPGVALEPESVEPAQERFPIPLDDADPKILPPEMLEGVLEAHPFSPQRRQTGQAPDAGPSAGSRQAPGPPRPAWVYKGRVRLGQRERAILEETASGKTHFLEVGQEVAGYKVLDIEETRVLLSELQTSETITVSLASGTTP